METLFQLLTEKAEKHSIMNGIGGLLEHEIDEVEKEFAQQFKESAKAKEDNLIESWKNRNLSVEIKPIYGVLV